MRNCLDNTYTETDPSAMNTSTAERLAVSVSSGRVGAQLWARTDLRRRWKSLVVLGLLAGLAAGLAMASLAGARRTATAFDRLRHATIAADAVAFPSQVGAFTPDWSRLEKQPYIVAIAPWKIAFGLIEGQQGSQTLFIPKDDRWLNETDRPVVVKGRMYNPDALDEVVVDEFAEKAGLPIGTKVTYRMFLPTQDDTGKEPPAGPALTFRVVGVIRETSEFLFANEFIIAPPSVIKKYGSRMFLVENGHVRIRDWEQNMAKLITDAPELLAPGTPVLDLHAQERRISTALTVERAALLLLALAVALAGLVFAGQALIRSASTVASDSAVLRAIGLTRSQMAEAAATPHVVSALTAMVAAVIAYLALATRFPIGVARTVDPALGLSIDWAVLSVGTVLAGLLVLGGAYVVGWRTTTGRRQSTSTRPSLAGEIRKVLPVSIGTGTAMALDPGSGRTKVPVRPALVGAVVGVLGVVSALTVGSGLNSALRHPERVGVGWQAVAIPPGLTPSTAALKTYAKSVAAAANVGPLSIVSRTSMNVNGTGVPNVSIEPVRGEIIFQRLSGRVPSNNDEAAIGSSTARQLGVKIGDQVMVGESGRKVTIVGKALFPSDPHSGIDEGLWITPDTFDAVAPRGEEGQLMAERWVALKWRDGVNADAALTRLQEDLGPISTAITPAYIPQELTNLKNVRSIPLILVVFLVLFALATLVHALASSVRSRSQQFAILRALGFTRRMTRTVIGSQGSTVGLIGLLLGVPIGAVLGRSAWAWMSDRLPLFYVSPLVIGIVVIVVVLVLLVVNAVALEPARRISRITPAELLRTE